MIAAWWGDADTTDPLATEPDGNQVFYAVTATRFVATWIDVGYFDRHVDLLNAFQIVLTPAAAGPAGAFDVELRYHRCEWLMADGSAIPAQAGLDAADGVHSVSLPGSRSSAMLALCTMSNAGMPGVWHLSSVVPAPTCGNGLLETGESCDDGNHGDHDYCGNDCEMRSPCITIFPDGAIDFPFPLPDANIPDASVDANGNDAAGGLPFIDANLPHVDSGGGPLPDVGPAIGLCPGDDAARPDGGRRPDAGTRFDANIEPMDAGGRGDSGPRTNELDVTGGGCGCRAGARSGSGGWLALLGLVAVAFRRSSAGCARSSGSASSRRSVTDRVARLRARASRRVR
jgi:MYXO-CTERM domain-containing protein